MVLKLYYDLMSQPSRALYMFLRATKIPYEDCPVALRKGEHFTEEYAKINPFKKVPAIDHDGFKLTESVAILRYLTETFRGQIPEHWYPADPKRRARVDEFMAWQHLNLRANGSLYFRGKFLEPEFFGKPRDDAKLQRHADRLVVSLQEMEDVFLNRGKPFLCDNDITVADLLGSCEVEQPRSVGFDVFTGRPKLEAWMNRVRATLQPHFDQAHVINYKLLEKYGSAKL